MATALVYGAYGYTGELIARFAKARGLRVILAGRDQAKTNEVARRWCMDQRVFGLDDARALDMGLTGVDVVLHCAGPFSRTSRPMLDACLRGRIHYLDITGEIGVFEACAARDAEARAAGIMVLPGVGFDVVPSDCLAAHLAERLPGATHLALAFLGLSAISHGTATTMAESAHLGSCVRRDGKLTSVPAGALTRTIDFGRGAPRRAIAIPWGDVSTAFHTTGIPNIEVYLPLPRGARVGVRALGLLSPVVASRPVQELLKRAIDARPAGPTDEQRTKGAAILWGEVRDARGGTRVSRLRTPDGYTLTADAALTILRRVLEGDLKVGYQTPASAYGKDLVMALEGVSREDL